MHTLSPTLLPTIQPPHCLHSSPIPTFCQEASPALPHFAVVFFHLLPPHPHTLSGPLDHSFPFSLLSSFGTLFPLLPQLLLPPDCIQPQHTGVTDLYTPPRSSSQPVCRRASRFMKEDRGTWDPRGSHTAHSGISVCS